MTVAELEERMGNGELAYWAAYHGRRAQREELAAKMAKGKG